MLNYYLPETTKCHCSILQNKSHPPSTHTHTRMRPSNLGRGLLLKAVIEDITFRLQSFDVQLQGLALLNGMEGSGGRLRGIRK